ncbi:MAG: hypothetical protein FWD34_01095 [Oscillospiraceae bacterium]|nr:hypothetical protein [Oscillospiraceae bacterium]
MKNNQLLPFERNRYYAGKLLTSADFLAEQTYLNNKRRFINSLLFGPGIVCGLSVYNLDDLSVMIESGAAIDKSGRELVLENSTVKKLSAMEGYNSLETEEVCLCFKYAEEETQSVYSINVEGDNGSEYEPNRIRESGTLFLIDKANMPVDFAMESEFLVTANLYSDEDYSINISMPAIVSCGCRVRVVVEITKISDTAKPVSLNCTLQTPAFTNDYGEHELMIKADEILPAKEQPVVISYWLNAQEYEVKDTMIIVKSNFAKINVGSTDMRLPDNFIMKVMLSKDSAVDLIEREIAKVSLETKSMQISEDFIRLADITIQRTNNSYIIDSIDENSAKQFIRTASAETQRREYGEWFSSVSGSSKQGVRTEYSPLSPAVLPEPVYASGVCEISLGNDSKKGSIVYSDEIMHGLGKGNVHVSVGFEYLAEDKKLQNTAKNTIYGNATLFNDKELPIAYADTAIKVMNDRGSFMVAARLIRDTNYVVIPLRWVAVKLPSGEEQTMLRHVTDKSISAVQPTVVIGTRESHFFDVHFKNMAPVTLNYMLTESDSGTITADGIYTAPGKEGVYEILISCAEMPMIRTYAYAVVKKKGLEDNN